MANTKSVPRRTTAAEIGTRQRIVTASSELFRRQGYAGTGMKAIVAASDAPYGSIYHFFPGGKEELGVAALTTGGESYRELVELFFPPGADVVAATTDFFDRAAEMVESTDYAEACPVASVALEVAGTSVAMRRAAAAAFASWLAVLRQRLVEAGIAPDRAAEMAVELFCAIEGAFLLARVTRDAEPIRIAGRASAARVAEALRVPRSVGQ